MAWYDTFQGHPERIDMSKATSGSGRSATALGDAFRDIGKLLIDSDAQREKQKLINLQVQNQQNQLDEFQDNKKQKKLDNAFALDIKTLDPSSSTEATQNAVEALKAFHTPSVQAVASQEQETKAKAAEFQSSQDKKYLGDTWTLDPTVSKEARKNALDALGEFYKPETTAQDKAAEHFKALDGLAQTKFNDEAILQSVSGGFKNMKEFTAAHPELVKNADGVTMAKIEGFYSGKEKDAQTRADSDRMYGLQVSKLNHDVSNDNKTLALQAQKGGSNGEKDSKVVDAINKIIVTKYGKTDGNGMVTMNQDSKDKAEWLGTRALFYASQGNDASGSFVQAERDWNRNNKPKAKQLTKKAWQEYE